MDEHLQIIAEECREAMERFANKHENVGDPDDLACFCAISSYFLRMVALKFGYKLILVEGNAFDDWNSKDVNHCWNQYKTTIIDLTATQFSPAENKNHFNKVHITSVNDESYLLINKTTKARKNLKHVWPRDQSPYDYLPELRKMATQVADEIAA